MNIFQRLFSDTPAGMKKIRNYAAIIAVFGGAVITAIGTCGITAPAAVLTVLTLVTTIAGGVAGGAQCATKEEPDSDQPKVTPQP